LAIVKTPAKSLLGGVSKNKKIRERVDSEGQYGRWRLLVMGSCSCRYFLFCEDTIGNFRFREDPLQALTKSLK